MGARKKRQEEPCWQQELSPTYKTNPCYQEHEANNITNPGRQANYNRANVKCSSCCNTIKYPGENDELTNNTSQEWPRVNDKSSPSPDAFPSLASNILSCLSISKICVKFLLKGNIRSRNSVKNENFYYDKSQVKRLVHLLILLIVASSSLVVVPVNAVCVWQGGGGFKVACGFRQSGLFRIRSIGGIKGYVGAGFTVGDEDGFKDSLTNTEPQQSGAYVIPNNVHSQRSLPGPHNGLVGQYSQIYEHAIPIPTGDPAAQKYQKIQYLDNIQIQMDSDHTNLQQMATDQQTQQMLQQQLNLQGGFMPPPPPQPPAPTAKVKRAGTGLTKRASLWNWPNIFRGKNGKNGNKNKRPNGQRNGPPQGPNRRGGPPPPNHHNKQSKPPGKNGPPPGKNGPPPGKNGPPPGRRGPGRRGPFPPQSKNPRQQQRPEQSSFSNPMKNPFAHLQDNFIGKSNSQEAKQMHNFQQGQDIINQNFASGRNQFPPQPFTQGKNFFQPGQIPFSGENSGQLPQQFMMPPASPESLSPNMPQFKKIPNNQKPVDRQDDYVDENFESQQQHYADNQPPPSPTVDRMLVDVDDSVMQGPPEYAPPSQDYMTSAEKARASLERQVQEAYEADPAGLKLLKQTENFGTIYHLINPDGSPVNMQFEKRPTVPPLVHFSSQQQQDLAEELASVLPPPNSADVGMEGELIDSNLATAVYDPNIFPDIYFTTTEKHKHQDSQQNLDLFGGNYGLSQEQMDNPTFIDNQIKRILGVSAEKTGSGSSEGGGGGFVRQGGRRRAGAILRSNEVSSDQQQQVVMPRRKMRRRKKFRLNQQINNHVDTSEPDLTGPDASATPPAPTRLPKRRRKGRRRKKYKLHTASPHLNDEAIASSTERMGLPASGADGGELTSSETKTESPTPDPLTTTPGPQRNVVIVTPTSPVAYSEDGSINLDKSNDINNAVAGNKKLKTSFTLPSNEDVTPTSTENLLLGAAGPSSENTIDTSAGVTSSTKKASEETTTRMPMSFSTFGYFDALRGKNKNEQDDYDFTGPSGSGNYFGGDYDPRFPPGHEMNRGHNMSRFIRPRGQNSTGSTDDNSNGPFILYDMTGTRNQSRFSSKFHQETSSFRLDEKSDPNRVGNAYSTQSLHPFYTNNKQAKEKGVFLKLDSNEWSRDQQNSHYQNDHSSDPFSKHYNKTSLNNGGYYSSGASKEFRPSVEIPWERGYNTPSTPTTKSSFSFVGGSAETKYPKSGGDQHSIFGGPTMETFGLPKASTPLSSSGEKQHKKLHKNLFGGSSADVSDLGGNWASPNFWGNLQEGDRYNPRVDFEEKNNNLKRLMTDFSSPNGLKEMAPVDLSSATPLPMPAPSSSQNTMEDLMDGPTYFLPPSTPGERWGKQRKRKGRPTTTAAPTTPSSIPFIMSTLATTAASPSPTSAAPSKWMAIMSNEVDMPPEYYDNISMMPPRSSSTEVKRNKEKIQIGKGIEIKFKSGEIQDPEEEEEEQQQQNQNNSSSTTAAAASSQNHFDILSGHGFPGVMVHDFDSSAGYGFGDTSANDKSMRGPPPPPPGMPNVHIRPPPGSDVSYYPDPNVNSDNRDRNGKVSSGPLVFPPMAQFGPPPTHNENNNRKSAPVFPGRQNNIPRREFVPSAEDLGPLPPMPPTTLIVGSGSGIPRHKDNPFKLFEKQNAAVNSNFGFVSATHELREMEDQISKFSKLPEGFLKRDSSEKKMGGGIVHAPNMDGPQFHGPPAPPPSSSDNMNIPGFVTIPLPSIEQNPVHNMVHSGANPTSFGPSGFPSNLRDSEKTSFSGPPSGREEYQSPSMPPTGPAGGMHGHNAQHPGPPPGIPQDQHNVPWDFHPLDNNELGPPPSQVIPLDSEEEFRRHRPPHLRDERPSGPPPQMREERPSGPPPHMREERPSGPPPHMREERPSGPPPHMREERPSGPPPHMREERPSGPPPHMRDERPSGPPPHVRDGRPPGPPPHIREGRPPGPLPHLRDGPPHMRDERPSGPPPHLREERPSGPPPHMRDERPPGPPPHMRDERPPGPPPHMRDERPPPHLREDRPPGPPQHMRDGPPGPPHHLRNDAPEHLRPPPPPRDDHERRRPPHDDHPPMRPPPPMRDDHPPIRHSPPRDDHQSMRPPPREDHPSMRPPPREDHPSMRPPPREDHPSMRPPPREDHPSMRPPPREDHPPMRPPPREDHPSMRPPPREDHPSMRPPPREDHPPMRPPPREDHLPMRPPPREDHPPMRPPPREDHPPMRPPPREDHPPMRPPPREDHPPMRPPPRGNNHMRDEHPSRPPHPHRDERPGGPPGHREPERRPPPDFEREFSPPHPTKGDGPPRHHPEDRFRDGPHHGHENNRPPPPRPGPPGGFFPDKPMDNHRPPPRDHFHDKLHEHRGEHISFNNWQDDKDQFLRGDSPPNGPPTPHGMPDFLDIQKVPKKDQRPFKEPKDPFHHKHPPPPPGGKKPMSPGNPAKIPPQVFKPPLPPPKSQHSGNFFTNFLNGGPFGKHTSSKMHPPPPRTHQMPPPPPNSRPHPPPPQNHPRKPPIPMPPQPDHFERDPFQSPHFQEPPPLPNNPNNYINSFNDRYEPPPAQHSPPLEDPNHKLHLRPELLPPPMPPHHVPEHAGSRLPFLPFPQRPGGSFETSLVDLDQDPHAHLLPPTLLTLPQQPYEESPSLPVRHHQNPPKETPRPVYQPKPTKKMDEKTKIKEAFETLNKANYDVIHSLAADQFGQKFIDKIKTKNNLVQEPLFPPTTTTQVPLLDMFAFTSKKPTVQDENAQLAELWKMISNKSSNKHAQQMASASTMGSHSPSGSSMESLSSLLQKLSKPAAPPTTPPTTTTTTQRVVPELPSNPGLVSLTSLNHGSNHDIKSLQAQIAKAIIAKAHKKSHVNDQLEKPHYQPLQINAPSNESPLNVLQQLAQNRHDTISHQTASKNYTASQLETLKKLLALNNLEEKLVTTPSTTTTENPLRKLQALLPAAIKAAKQPEYISSNTITRKMLDSTTAHSVAHRHNNHLLQNADPTLLALKAIAMSKSQGINPQPSISLPQQVKPTEPSSQPIAVDLSAILSPSPPVVEAKRKRRLTNVRNAPKSFFPANATQGFEEYSGALMTEFQCDEQSFFPGLYADTELGCRVFHLCAKTEAGYMMKSFRCPKETVFDQEVLRCNWNLFVECPASRKKYHFNKYLSQSFQFLKILGEFSANIQKSDATMTG